MPQKVNLAEKFATFDECWAPRIVARYEGHEVRIAKLEGEFHWHKHDHDELFLLIEGELEVEFRDEIQVLAQGELLLIPSGVEHRPVASKGLAKLMIMDPAGAPNTGDETTATKAVDA